MPHRQRYLNANRLTVSSAAKATIARLIGADGTQEVNLAESGPITDAVRATLLKTEAQRGAALSDGQSRKPDRRISPLVRMIKSGSGRSAA